MPADLIEHVIEETESRADIRFALAVKIHMYLDVRLIGFPLDGCGAIGQAQDAVDLFPASGNDVCMRLFFVSQQNRFGAKIPCQFHISFPVADYVRSCKIVIAF